MRHGHSCHPRCGLRSDVLLLLFMVLSSCRMVGEDSPAQRRSQEDKAAVEKELATFRFRGRPIHPESLRRLVATIADPLPTAAAIDVEGFFCSEDAHREVVERDGTQECSTGPDPVSGVFKYRWIGVTPGGTHVVETRENGGGTGWFYDLLFVRFEFDEITEEGNPSMRLTMRSVGSHTLGDRPDVAIELQESTLKIVWITARPPETVRQPVEIRLK